MIGGVVTDLLLKELFSIGINLYNNNNNNNNNNNDDDDDDDYLPWQSVHQSSDLI